ncbi:hypothetical protein GCM10011491_28970 [Brucella endophytica]|uniref:Organic solvent tolerance-like N-terminal domain-containing protein n=1 Tax=Brucella endophytica TaxID=1963359 RepID=A0A916SH17_9HYPH|nr:LptA/OstA family protein [Brucella endophytica]GGA98926.1 hypothetical protein GCM10011491_28970 [Brucella endophytica]
MNKLLIAATVSLFALNGVAFAATETVSDFQVQADTIKVKDQKTHAAGHVVITQGNTTIKMKRAIISKDGDKILIEAPGNHALKKKS